MSQGGRNESGAGSSKNSAGCQFKSNVAHNDNRAATSTKKKGQLCSVFMRSLFTFQGEQAKAVEDGNK